MHWIPYKTHLAVQSAKYQPRCEAGMGCWVCISGGNFIKIDQRPHLQSAVADHNIITPILLSVDHCYIYNRSILVDATQIASCRQYIRHANIKEAATKYQSQWEATTATFATASTTTSSMYHENECRTRLYRTILYRCDINTAITNRELYQILN